MPTLPDWARAHGVPLFAARLRATAADFQVEEITGFEFSGDGEHDVLQIQKTGANTAWVADALMRHAGVRHRDVGYAGLKDRHAVTTQWFSVRRPSREGTDWQAFRADGVEILDIQRHRKKLRRGALRGNRFRIALRGEIPAEPLIKDRLAAISTQGVPNYFGEQRFGRDAANLALAERLFGGERLARAPRGFAISAARSLLFNRILDARVRDGSWQRLLDGELVNLDGSGSVFTAHGEDLSARLAVLDLHPTASMWGRGAPCGASAVAELERAVLHGDRPFAEGLDSIGVDAMSRSLRLRVVDLDYQRDDDVLWLQFRLTKGSYATAVVREITSIL